MSLFPWNMFPFNSDMTKLFKQMNPQEMEKGVQNMIAQFMPKERQGMFDHNDMLSRASSLFRRVINNQIIHHQQTYKQVYLKPLMMFMYAFRLMRK
ncbi:hypothetical protein H5P36_17225 [Bacillus sp. APMAM]|nr:hypothetical protein [Bacillus sp. APMAM]RTZ54763.1 hypothetical protein EKO25_16455 [Bacillus sp. SAJ1]